MSIATTSKQYRCRVASGDTLWDIVELGSVARPGGDVCIEIRSLVNNPSMGEHDFAAIQQSVQFVRAAPFSK